MNHLVKRILAILLSPLLRLLLPGAGLLRRLWAFVMLAAKISTPLNASVVVHGCPEIEGSGRVTFGRDLLLSVDLHFETRESGFIDIGDQVVISRGVQIVAHKGITIGAGSMIGEFTSIRDGNHRREANGVIRETGHESAPITIGRQVWIGRGVMVLPGVHIGDGATVGANAVVTRDVPAGVCVAGVPARRILPRVSQDHRAVGSGRA